MTETLLPMALGGLFLVGVILHAVPKERSWKSNL